MKQLYGKLWVKCTAIALLVVFAILFAASALGTAYLFTYGAYADGGEQGRQIAENEILQQTNGDGWTALHAWAEDDFDVVITYSAESRGASGLLRYA